MAWVIAMIEWIAISKVLFPFLKSYAADSAKKLAEGKLKEVQARLLGSDRMSKANEVFVARFTKELDSSMDLDTIFAASYQDALTVFLANTAVQDLLQAPLDGESELSWQTLRGAWAEMRDSQGQRLIDLPGGFNWEKVARLYRESIHKNALTDPELRPVFQAITANRTADAVERIAGPARAFDLARYAQAIQAAFGHLKLGSMDADWTDYERRVNLESVYVPQSAKQALPSRDLTRDYRELLKKKGDPDADVDPEELEARKREYAELAMRPLLEVVADPALDRLVILGDPGLGKSTLLKHLAMQWSQDPSGPVALFAELRQAHRGAGHADFLDYFEKGAGKAWHLPKNELHRHLQGHASLLLFDGLDEIPAKHRTDAVTDIIAFANEYPKARIVVTTRINGYHPGSSHPQTFRDHGFQQFTLQDFDDAEIDRFIRSWHREAFVDLTERERYESRMRRAIGDSPAIRELACNPLLLTMMAILSRNQDLPRDRGKLYERCAELLLKNWDLEKFPELRGRGRDLDIKDKLGPDQKMRILERVAAAMQQERSGLEGNLISEDHLKGIVIAELRELGVQDPVFAAEDLIWMLRERNFMLAFMGDHHYAFVHRTFLEYFCARDLKYRLERTSSFTVDDLRRTFEDRWASEEWHEVLRLLCGLIGAEHAKQCIEELLALEKVSKGEQAVFLAAQCLQEIRELGQVQGVRQGARASLLRLMRFDLPHYYQDFEAEGKEVARVRSRAVQELARGWKEDPGTLPLLKDRAAQDEHWAVRQAAVQELARGWKEDPGTLPLLKDRAAQDEDNDVRRVAVQELARGWKEDPGTLPLLKDRAAQDEHGAVRQAAVQELARGWKEDPEVRNFLATLRE